MNSKNSSQDAKAKRLASEATARLALGLPFDAIDFENGILIGVEADYPEPIWSSENVGKAIDLGTVSLVDGEVVEKPDHVELCPCSEDEAWEISARLCSLPLAELNEAHWVEPGMWFEIMSAKACTIAFVFKAKIAELAAVLPHQNMTSREACSELVLSA